MLHASTQKLIIKLYELTESGDIAWKDTPGRRSLFETEGYRVEIEANPPGVHLLDTEGLELEHASETELAAVAWPDGNGTFATHVLDMARRAQRAARGAEHAISRILSSLSAPPRGVEPALAASPPPSPHTLPDPAPDPAEADTAIERVLAVQTSQLRAVEPEVVEEPAPEEVEPQSVETQTAAEIVEEREAEHPETVIETAEPQLAFAEATAPITEPELPASESVIEAATVDPAPEPLPPPRAKSSFGSITSFDHSRTPSTPKAAAPEPVVQQPAQASEPAPQSTARSYPSSMLFDGISARTHQTVRGEPAPQHTPPPQPQPIVEKTPEKALEPATSGSSIYKPWT